MEFKTIGIVGAGVMGIGMAQALAETRHTVILVDLSDEILAKADEAIRKNLRFRKLLGRRVPANGAPANGANGAQAAEAPEPAEAILPRIHGTTDYQALAAADFLVENTTESWPVKQQVYRQLEAVCAPETIFGVNTSAFSITRVAAQTRRPDRVVGMHFMNPVPMKPTVEVIRGYHTSEQTLAATQRFLEQMGKTGIVVNDVPGFVSNRVLMLTINEAIFVVQDGVAKPHEVDRLFKECFGHKMGPLETADLIGLDTILLSLDVLYESFNDSKYRPSPLLKKMVDAGLLGRKSGQGFHTYA